MQSRRNVLAGFGAGVVFAILAACSNAPVEQSVIEAPGVISQGPVVTGPVVGGEKGWPFSAYYGDISEVGYVEEEYFLEGEAAAFAFAEGTSFTPDGKWSMTKQAEATPYKTRILVRRPADPAKFNGAVIVEWANVSSGYELTMGDPQGIYDGFAYVLVSAQQVGVHGFDPENPPRGRDPGNGLVQWDAERYGDLSLPADSFSYDIYTQAARAVGPDRPKSGVDPLMGLPVERLIGVGGSQSGSRLVSYINGVQPIEGVFDAIMPTVFGGTSATWGDGVMLSPTSPESRDFGFTKIRDDNSTKIFAMNSETEALYYTAMRQPDTDTFRYWEVAGASHGGTDHMKLIREKTDRDGITSGEGGDSDFRVSDVLWFPTFDAAIVHTLAWVEGGEAPPVRPKLEVDTTGMRPAFKRDEFGNALGGVRLPEVEVPIATYLATSRKSFLLGETHPFTTERLHDLYPTHADYVAKVTVAANRALEEGVILPYRVQEYIDQAQVAAVPD